uniref:Gem-associated protein 5 TPR domain-containing protein n=1 Tax=Fusarium oxysporum (strain Fo5176) TaxID=660025 RepID=A0A0D2Y8F1_FUSOF
MPHVTDLKYFDPCAATASMFLFSRHADEVQLLVVDNQSEAGGGRFVVSYDAGQTAIVWDLMTGDEISRFACYDHLTVAAWMKNGNVAFGPSPIVNLAWHASSPRQKSDMLAVQMHDGDLRVWSVAKKYSADDPAKVVRNLRKAEVTRDGPNWMGWSKNGRIIQYSDSQTQSWDVRTKHITHDPIPTLDLVRGLAVYGPGATLFTLGPNNTVQQFDLKSPAIMVANVQHPAILLPPSPPVSEESGDRSATSTTTIASESETSSIPLYMDISESDEDHLSPFARLTRRQAYGSGNEPYESASPVSSRSGLSSLSKSSAGSSQTPGRYPGSMRSRGLSENTYISATTSIRSSTIGNSAHGNTRDLDTYSMGYSLGTTSVPSIASSRSRRRPSRLRNEVPRSPDDNKVHDLFKCARARLSDIPYKHAMGANSARLTNDDLRRQMLNTIFGWNKEVEDLIRDEMSRHTQGSPSRILLAKWLDDINPNIMNANFENMTSSDWMLLALSGIGGHASQQKLGHTYVQRLLEAGDVHTAVTIMLGMGDHNDAIEVYISHKRYMEALILTCLSAPSVWERQAAIIRKWGKWAVQHGQQQLAIRCFACTDQESTEPWTSPSAAQLNFQTMTPSIPEILSPPLSPPGVQRCLQRSIAKTSALKLITSFGDQMQKTKFFAGDGGQTPIAAGVTPIADSARSPAFSHASNNEAPTAFLRPSNNSRFNTTVSARGRGRLPSIGEIPSDLKPGALRSAELSAVPDDYEPRSGHVRTPSGNDNMMMGTASHRAATASPMMMREHAQLIVQASEGDFSPPPDQAAMLKMQQTSRNHRNGSRDRIPVGVNLPLHPGPSHDDITSPEQSVTFSTRYHWPTRRRGPASVTGSVTSASSAGRSLRHQAVRNREDYIHSLDAAKHYSKRQRSRQRSHSRTRDASPDHPGSRERTTRSREPSEDRGRVSACHWPKAKRSPTSPIPMSPEYLLNLSTPRHGQIGEPNTVRKVSGSIVKPQSRNSNRGSRRRSPEGLSRPPALTLRARSQGRESSAQRSPSSPLPLSATVHQYQGSEDEENYRAAITAQEEFRNKHSRSSSRGLGSPALSKQDASEHRRRANSEVANFDGSTSTEHAGDLKQMNNERQRKKEQAARELEERRKSLAKRAQTPSIPHSNEFAPAFAITVKTAEPKPLPDDIPPRSATEPPQKSMYARNGPVIGLPATPKAMRLIIEGNHDQPGSTPRPNVPSIPASFSQRYSPETSPQQSPEREAPVPEPSLTLLRSTVYQPPARPHIPRSMSAPIPDEPGQRPARLARKSSVGRIEEVVPSKQRRSHEDPMPPPPPPAPPVLKEFRHLASPPPPPVPLQHAQRY